MRRSHLLLATAFAVFALAGCSKPETPAETQQDVTEAANEGAADVNAAVVERNEVAQEGAADVTAEMHDVTATANDAAKDNVEEKGVVDLAQARATYDVSVERCDAQAGAARDACRSEAQAVLDAAQARIEARN